MMILFATIFLALSTMATSQPSPVSAPEALSMMMDQFRSAEIIHVKRNGQTMMNPYHFYKGDGAAENQQLAVSLLERVHTAPIGHQPTFARQLALENDKTSPFMQWDAFVTGHVDIFEALRTFVTGAIGSPLSEASATRYTDSTIEAVFQASAETKTQTIEKFLVENPRDGSQLLYKAAVHGDETVLRYLINSGHEIHPKNGPSYMPLHAACYNGRLGAVQQLISAGIDVNHLDEFGSTPLMRAAAGRNAELVEWLLENGADATVRETRSNGSTALELGMGSASVASLLLNHGAEWSPIAFASAVHGGSEEAIELMSDRGGFVQFDLSPTDTAEQMIVSGRQREAMLLAIRHCASKQAASGEVLRWLLRHVATSYDGDVFVLDASDEQLLDAVRAGIGGAVHNDDVETARLLIKSLPPGSLSSETKEDNGSGTKSMEIWLLNAIHHNARSVTRMFFEELHMDPNALFGARFETPLATAALAGDVDMIKFLVSNFNVSIHKASGAYANGPTPLWHAVRSQNEGAARALLELGGPVESIHAAIKGGEKRLWLTAEKQDAYRSPVLLVAWMNPEWYDEDNDEMFLCLEFPDGFRSDLWIRKDDQELLDAGDERPLAVEARGGDEVEGSHGIADGSL